MTRTNAWWLLFGKWIARVFQAFLIGSTILPYVVLQYLNGGEELFDDLEFFIFIAVGNLILLATTVSLSVVRNPVVRGSSLVGLALSVLAVVVGYTSTDPTMMWDSFVIYTMLILTIGTIIVTLDLGSSDLTPYSAHNPLFRRLFCSVLFILTVIFYKFKASTSYSNIESGLIFLGSFIFMVYAAIEISREEYVSKRLIRPFKKLGWVGYILLLFFMPGRSSALLYMLTINATLLFLTLSLTTSSATPGDLYNRLWGTACVVGSLLIPLVLHVFFLKRLQVAAFIIGLFNVITLFFLIFAFQSLFHSYSIADSSFLGFFPCLATGTRVEVGVYSSGTPKESLFEAYFSLTVMIIALAVSSRYWLRVVHETWKETET
jgi:hypothetical protein